MVEMLVALALFALIGLAGFGVLNTILQAEDRSDGRMERVQSIDTALRLLARDLETGRPATLRLSADTVAIAAGGADADTDLNWRLEGGALIRRFRRTGKGGAEPAEPDVGVDQIILDDVVDWRWRGVAQGGTWVDERASDAADTALKGAEVVMDLRTGAGTVTELRRLFVLPDVAPPPPRPGLAAGVAVNGGESVDGNPVADVDGDLGTEGAQP